MRRLFIRRFVVWAAAIIWLIALSASSAAAQLAVNVTLTVEAGFDGQFRPEVWLPVRVRVQNDGEAIAGALVVRPETNGGAISNTYSTPVTLAAGARQTVTLYVTARSFATALRVELLDANGLAVATASDTVRAAQPGDRLYAVVTDSAIGGVDLTGARFGGQAQQVTWRAADLPDQLAGLEALNLILFTDVDTSALTAAQRAVLNAWLISGGHLIAAGGAAWQGVAAGLDSLPISPDGTTTIPDAGALGAWLRVPPDAAAALTTSTVIATGTLAADARVIAAQPDGTPLIARRSVGAGMVDYLALDPNAAPLRGWSGLPDLWYTLHSSRPPVPGWARGLSDWTAVQSAVEILPGFDPLPDLLPLLIFLFAYIALIGPLNYLVLARINKREWAWVTIPILITAFSVGAYVFGTSIRGTDATLNRLTVVQAFPGTETARIDGAIGMLAPRRGQYTLTTDAGTTLRTIPSAAQFGAALTRDVQSSVNIAQTDRFTAQSFTVDASFVAGFGLTGTGTAPAVRGSAAFSYDDTAGMLTARGSVTNDMEVTLHEPVIMASGVSERLPTDLEPGAVETFTLTLPGTGLPAASPALPAPSNQFNTFRGRDLDTANQSALDVIGPDRYILDLFRFTLNPSEAEQAARRDTFFFNGLIDDPFGSTGRGDAVYAAGWVDDLPLAVDLVDVGWESDGRTWIIVQLAARHAAPTRTVTIPGERFTWALRDRVGLGEIVPVELAMQPGDEVSFRFTPLADAVLREVDDVRLLLDDLSVTSSRRVPIDVWNWDAGRWDEFQITAQTLTLPEAAPYLGPFNAVEVRVVADDVGGFLRIGRLSIEQVGRF